MKVFAVITVARQIGGEYIAIRTEKAFVQAGKADEYLRELKKTFVTPEGKPKATRLSTPQGELDCICEAGAFEIEIVE
jgi:hypothetical protein